MLAAARRRMLIEELPKANDLPLAEHLAAEDGAPAEVLALATEEVLLDALEGEQLVIAGDFTAPPGGAAA